MRKSHHQGLWASACALSLLACSPGPAKSPAENARGSGAPTASTPPVTTTATSPKPSSFTPKSPLLHSDGKVNYEQLQLLYGAPNTNVELNPRAETISARRSAPSVRVQPDRLIFPKADLAWARTHHRGDVLYCDATCNRTGFIRIIDSIESVDGAVVVRTSPGKLTDVIQHGWIHAEIPISVPVAPGAHPLPSRTSIPPGAVGPGNQRMTGNLSGHLSATPSFQYNLVTDLAISHGFLGFPSGIDLLEFELEGAPSITIDAELTATGTASEDWQFSKNTIPITGIPVPVLGDIGVDLTLTLSGHAEASGQLDIQSQSSLTYQVQAGFIYTSQDGLQIIDQHSLIPQQSFSGSGSANAQAYVQLAAELGAHFLGNGVGIEYDAQLGVEGLANTTANSATGACSIEFQGDFFFRQKGQADLDINLLLWSKQKSLPFFDSTSRFPDPPWTFTDDIACTGSGSTSSGSGTTTSSSSSGSTGGSSGSTTGTSGGGDICAACTVSTDCASGYCNPAGFCDSANACTSDADCDSVVPCDTASGYCSCETGPVCYPCSANTDCTSGNCNPSGYCDSASACTSDADCDNLGTCDTGSGSCLCGSGYGPICSSCSASTDCASGFCNQGGFCDSATNCTSSSDCNGTYACDTNSGSCICQ